LSHFETGTLPLCHPGNQNGRVCCHLKALLPKKFAEYINKENV